ncbi:hypothetical protein SAMN06265337_0302 [Hymenobacter gelipurpurascens]|uniref:Uncharacterized protein n=1 Tax=Hymenobacter gelipurpurascens TaxID=89968 RepID=A0A212T3L9_9BACT|nr:hypothetical protein [Hymenobacter gelipurpurascens]SNC60643.1 hypothetical protein SAMN06265337_0302 [Hymenobacter gelipurpurascens]
MNTEESIIRICAMLGIFGGLALQISHVLDQSTSRTISTFGFALAVVAYSRYARRLQTENQELRQRLEQRQEL